MTDVLATFEEPRAIECLEEELDSGRGFERLGVVPIQRELASQRVGGRGERKVFEDQLVVGIELVVGNGPRPYVGWGGGQHRWHPIVL